MSKRYSSYENLLTVGDFKNRFLHSVDLRSGDGDILTDITLESYIRMGIDYVEHSLECPIQQTDFTEQLDYNFQNYNCYCYLQLYHYPIISIEYVKLIWGNIDNPQISVNFPAEWYKIYETPGQIQLLPTSSTLSSLVYTTWGSILPRAIGGKYAPQLLIVKGKYGVSDEFDKVQPLVNQAIGLYAAMQLLQMIGDISPAGPGVASSSVSVDGLSNSISTALSATSNLFNATIDHYKNMLEKSIMPLLKKSYKRIGLVYI